MFTGIITDIGRIRTLENRGDLRARIETGYDTAGIEIGASIACDGVCLTAVALGGDWFDVDISAETVSKTNIGDWAEGGRINLERALKVGDELGGHIVSGHVDGLAIIETITPVGDSFQLEMSLPDDLSKFVAEKGSVTLDGISLTVNKVSGNRFGVNIIDHTWTHTTLGQAVPGQHLNLEIDMLARYVSRLISN